MNELVKGYIECFVSNQVVEYKFVVNREKWPELFDTYCKAVNSESPLRIACSSHEGDEVMVIAGQVIKLSTIHFYIGDNQ